MSVFFKILISVPKVGQVLSCFNPSTSDKINYSDTIPMWDFIHYSFINLWSAKNPQLFLLRMEIRHLFQRLSIFNCGSLVFFPLHGWILWAVVSISWNDKFLQQSPLIFWDSWMYKIVHVSTQITDIVSLIVWLLCLFNFFFSFSTIPLVYMCYILIFKPFNNYGMTLKLISNEESAYLCSLPNSSLELTIWTLYNFFY